MDAFINIEIALARYPVSRRSLYYWMRAGFVAYVTKGRSRLVSVADLERKCPRKAA